jgi:anti-anti-sigma regulatory factor
MATNIASIEIDNQRVSGSLRDALANMEQAGREMVLDFSSVERLDTGALSALQELAGAADGKGVTVALSGVGIELYRVLKLTKLAPRFSYVD